MSSSDRAEVSTLRSQLEDVLARVVAIADRYRDTPDSAVAADLDAAERAVITASRALDRASREL